jgi:hypothetical protein
VRNNQDRLSAITKGEDPPVQQSQQAEQPLQFITPTEFVELPSRGVFYPEGHSLHGAETIEIRHMTAKDEDILTSTALLRKGLAIDRLLQNVIVDRSIKVADLLVGDKNAIILAARISGYGADYEASVVCPSCNASVKFDFDLQQCPLVAHNVHEEHDVALTANNTFIVHLDKMNLDVEVKLLTSKDEIRLLQLSENKRKKKLPETPLTDQLRQIIVAVGGNTNPGYIGSFIQHMPATDSRKLRTTYQKIVPNVDMTHDFLCSSCGHEGEVNVPFGTNFFWPKQ